jgi:hypothetical protein
MARDASNQYEGIPVLCEVRLSEVGFLFEFVHRRTGEGLGRVSIYRRAPRDRISRLPYVLRPLPDLRSEDFSFIHASRQIPVAHRVGGNVIVSQHGTSA